MSLEKKPPKRRIGYARVSTQSQDLARQTKALERLGCAPIYSDKASGKSMAGRPELASALADLDTGDEFVIAEWDRATRSMWDGLQIIKAVIDAGASIKVRDRSLYRPHDADGARLHGDDVGDGRGPTLAPSSSARIKAGKLRKAKAFAWGQAEAHAAPGRRAPARFRGWQHDCPRASSARGPHR
jgi:hypothetical protein